jgi:hypothetical protein
VASLEAGGNPLVTEAPNCNAETRCAGHVENAWRQGAYQRALGDAIMNRPGMSGDSNSWEGWSHVRWFVEEVPAGAA